MKKILFVFTVAAVALTACTNESTEYVGSGPEAKEIAFSPISQATTRTAAMNSGAIEGTTFPIAVEMLVAAYDQTNTRDFFTETEFAHKYAGSVPNAGTEGYWAAKTAKYWPLSPTNVNFLAIANANGTVTWDYTTGGRSSTGYKASAVQIAMTNNYAYNTEQHDLLYSQYS